MSQERIGVMEISGYLSTISDFLRQAMTEFWTELGVQTHVFLCHYIDIDDSGAEGKKIVEAMASKSARQIEGYTYQQEQAFNAMQGATKGGGMGVGLGLGMGMGMGEPWEAWPKGCFPLLQDELLPLVLACQVLALLAWASLRVAWESDLSVTSSAQSAERRRAGPSSVHPAARHTTLAHPVERTICPMR